MGTMSALPSASFFWSLAQRASAGYCPQATEQDVSSPRFLRLLASLLNRASETLGACPTDAQILSAGMRSVVIRVQFSPGTVDLPGPGEVPSVILKYFRRKDSASNSGGFGYLREKHGLDALHILMPGSFSRVLGANDDTRLLILEHVDGVSVDKLLAGLGADSGSGVEHGQPLAAGQEASARLTQVLGLWSDFWAGLLLSPAQDEAQRSYRTALLSADTDARYPGGLTSPQLAFKGLTKLATFHGIETDSSRYRELEQQVESIVFPSSQDSVLSSADFSPQNLLVSHKGDTELTRGIDAEGTAIHHWALPVAEVLLGFPSHPGSIHSFQVNTPAWRDACNNFYQRVQRGISYATPTEDPRVQAALVAIRAILYEQKTSIPGVVL